MESQLLQHCTVRSNNNRWRVRKTTSYSANSMSCICVEVLMYFIYSFCREYLGAPATDLSSYKQGSAVFVLLNTCMFTKSSASGDIVWWISSN